MARTYSKPIRMLLALAAIIAALIGLIAGGVQWGSASWTPKLALDLAGGTEFVLKAKPAPGQEGTVTSTTMAQAVAIIRQRVNGNGVAEADVTTYGTDSIVVSLPGEDIDERTRNAIKRSAAMEFRAVLVAQPPVVPEPSASASASGSASASSSASASATGSASAAVSKAANATSSASASATSSVSGDGLKMATPSPTPATGTTITPVATNTAAPSTTPTGSPAATSAASGAASASPSGSASPAPSPTDASDQNWLNTPGVLDAWQSTDCTTPEGIAASQDRANDPAKPLVACEADGSKYVLGPVEVYGRDITDATAGLQQNAQGQTTGAWAVNLTFNSEGAAAFAKVTSRLFGLTGDDTRNRFAIVLDNLVISAPSTNAVIADGRAEITGGFTQQSAQQLANELKFGALPLSFETLTESQITATLGDQQLQRGLLAGLIGLLLVVLYSLAQYRALGLVTVGSLLVAGLLTYLIVVLLGWRQGYRLSLAGIAGLIVAIGITADSFIVYFERIRDEVREGRPLQAAVELAWSRALRTILISDLVSFIAAAVLYLLAVGGVQGFAFTLGLTTLVDVLVVFLFTKPVVTLLARTRFFGGGHRLSGFDAAHLGRQVSYTGRGTTRSPARERAAALEPKAERSPVKPSEQPRSEPADNDDPFGGSRAKPAADEGQRRMTIAERRAAERARTSNEPSERSGGTAVIEEND